MDGGVIQSINDRQKGSSAPEAENPQFELFHNRILLNGWVSLKKAVGVFFIIYHFLSKFNIQPATNMPAFFV
jgi:hypothetical protein